MRRRCYRVSKHIVDACRSAGIALTVGIAIVSLLLRPVAGDAAEAARQRRAVAVPASVGATGTHRTAEPSRGTAGKGAMAASEAARGGMVRLPGHILDAVAHTPPEPKAPGADAEPLTLTLVLNRTDQAGFDRYLHDVYDPQSRTFRHFLSQRELARRFGPSRQAYAQLEAYLRAKGFQLAEGSANRLTLTMRGPRAAAERAFAIHIRDYRLGSAQFYANDADPALPRRLAASVHSVSALSNYQEVERAILSALCEDIYGGEFYGDIPFDKLACAAQCEALAHGLLEINPLFGLGFMSGCLIMDAVNILDGVLSHFGISNLNPSRNSPQHARVSASSPSPAAQIDGTGQKIGLLEFSNFNPSDVKDYLALLTATGFSPAPFANLLPADCPSGTCPGKSPAYEAEVLLDIDAVMLLAPGAQVAVYEAPWGGVGSFVPLLNRMINGGVSIISNSWLSCENHTAPADARGIDTVLQQAAAAGISVFNASGDWGSACNDRSPNTTMVPADSPNATAVGGSSLTVGLGYTYGSESWWDGTQQSPTAPGQGGFGESKYFARPGYQNGLTTSPQRSVPDVAVNADPAKGLFICQADAGGCPTGKLYGGTSFAAPQMAAYTALLNDSLGRNIGAFNQAVYPFANTAPFHDADSMGSDFAHVGLGSPNLDVLSVQLAGATVGAPDPTRSRVLVTSGLLPTNHEPIQVPFLSAQPMVLPADGSIQGVVVVELRDANGHGVSGKTVTLAASGGNAQITPASGVSSVNNGAVAFTVTDLQAETVTFTATDTTDGIPLSQTASITFAASAVRATAFGLDAGPTPVTNNGTSTTWITATLQDALGRPTPGKEIRLSQGSGHSVISGPIPGLTNAYGQVVFTATDQVAESVTYSAVDVTDGNVPFPTTATVTFVNGAGNSCGPNQPVPAPGFAVVPFATGFDRRGGSIGSVSWGTCPGAYGLAFDPSGNLYVSDVPTGKLYRFGPAGGVAGGANLITTIAEGLSGLAFDGSGHLYAARMRTTGDWRTGAIQQLDPSTGAVMRTLSSPINCPLSVAVDPLSGDLFTSSGCYQILFGGDDSIWRISNPLSASPTTTRYLTTKADGGLPGLGNVGPFFAPNGTMYAFSGAGSVAQVGGTDTPSPAALTSLAGVTMTKTGLIPLGAQATGAAESLILEATVGGTNVLTTVDLTTNPPSPGAFLTAADGGVNEGGMVRGPDGCIYWGRGDTIFKVTDDAGGCGYTAAPPTPTLVLTPSSVLPNPAQGTSKTFTATFHDVRVPVDTPVLFRVNGANSTFQMVKTTAAGTASFTYAGALTGTDTLVATATVGTQTLTSNAAYVTWAAGKHTTFCDPNLSPQGGTVGTPATLSASLFDASVSPPVAVSGATVTLAAGGRSCPGVTDATGLATCTITPTGAGQSTMTATFAATTLGTTQLLGTSCSTGFTVLAPLCPLTPVTCQAAAARKASLRLGKGRKSAKTNSFRWRWTSSGNVSVGDLGSPTTTTDYTLCLYDNAVLKMTARVGAGGTCGRRPCWKPKTTAGNPVGFAYSNRFGTPDGVKAASLTAGSAGKAKIAFSGRGANLPVPTLPLTTPVRLQLHKSGSSACWDATYSKAGTNRVSAFRATSD